MFKLLLTVYKIMEYDNTFLRGEATLGAMHRAPLCYNNAYYVMNSEDTHEQMVIHKRSA